MLARAHLYLLLLIALCAGSLSAAPSPATTTQAPSSVHAVAARDKFDAAMDKANADLASNQAEAQGKYRADLERLLNNALKSADIEDANWARSEIARAASDAPDDKDHSAGAVIPKTKAAVATHDRYKRALVRAQSLFLREAEIAREAYLGDLEGAKRAALTELKDLDEGNRITAEITRVRALKITPAARADDGKTAFISLFDGKTLTGWEGMSGFWSVRDGAISGEQTAQHPAPRTCLVLKAAVTDPDKYADFELHYSYKFMTPEGKSGVHFRSKVLDEQTFNVSGLEADCDASRQYDGSISRGAGAGTRQDVVSGRGEKTTIPRDNKRDSKSLPEASADLQKLIKPDDWNDVILIARGSHITFTINGHLMTDLTDQSPLAATDGIIALQLRAGVAMEVRFKDIRIRRFATNPK